MATSGKIPREGSENHNPLTGNLPLHQREINRLLVLLQEDITGVSVVNICIVMAVGVTIDPAVPGASNACNVIAPNNTAQAAFFRPFYLVGVGVNIDPVSRIPPDFFQIQRGAGPTIAAAPIRRNRIIMWNRINGDQGPHFDTSSDDAHRGAATPAVADHGNAVRTVSLSLFMEPFFEFFPLIICEILNVGIRILASYPNNNSANRPVGPLIKRSADEGARTRPPCRP